MSLHPAARSRRLRAGLLALLVAAALPAADGPVAWQAPQTLARGAGERGPWQQNDSRYDFVDDPTVAWGPQGELAVAWVDQRPKAVRVQRLDAASAASAPGPVEVDRTPAVFSWLPRLAWAPDDPGRLHVLWQEIVFSGGSHGGEIFAAVSRDGGRRFEPPLNLSRSQPGDGKGRTGRDHWHNGSFDLATAPGGRVFAAWTEYDGRLWFTRSTDGGRRFEAPLRVAGEPPAAPARAPALAVAADGTVLLAWATGEDDAADIQVARSPDGGRSFGRATAAARTPGYSDAPKLAFDARGVLHLVHTEHRAGPSSPSAVQHLRSTDGGRRFAPAAAVPALANESAAHPDLGIDGRGRVVVIWERVPRPGAAPPYGLGLAVADDGQRFGPAEPVPGSLDPDGGFNGSTQGLLMRKLAVRADGELAIVNSALRTGTSSRVWIVRGRLR